jgi:hypothetical protein
MNNVIHCSSIHYIYKEVITRKLGLAANTIHDGFDIAKGKSPALETAGRILMVRDMVGHYHAIVSDII